MFKTLKPCGSCRSWRDCSGHWFRVNGKDFEYYKLGEVQYCRFQTTWIIAEFLRVWADEIIVMRDTWPSEPQETGYTKAAPTQHAISAHAPFEKVLQVVAEIRNRLAKTGSDGRELVLMVENKSQLSTAAKNALGYCSGWKRKHRAYRGWKSDKKYQKAERNLSFRQVLTKS